MSSSDNSSDGVPVCDVKTVIPTTSRADDSGACCSHDALPPDAAAASESSSSGCEDNVTSATSSSSSVAAAGADDDTQLEMTPMTDVDCSAAMEEPAAVVGGLHCFTYTQLYRNNRYQSVSICR